MSDATEELKGEVERLRQIRDEIKLKLHLAGMDARDTWSKLNAEAEETTRQIGKTSRAAVEDVVTRLRRFSASLSAATKSS